MVQRNLPKRTAARRFFLPLLLCAGAIALVGGGTSLARPCDPTQNPNCGGGGGGPVTTTITATLTVTAPAAGTVTSNDGFISCPGDCTQDYHFDQTCDAGECTDDSTTVDTVVLTGTRSGFTPNWSGCGSVNVSNQCTVTMDNDRTVSVSSWTDVQDPSVTLGAVPSKVGPNNTALAATASDNAGVNDVKFLVDGVQVGSADSAAPYEGAIPINSYTDGSTHTVSARAQDSSGRQTTTATQSFTVDKHVSGAFASPSPAPGATVDEAPQFYFTKDADVTTTLCRTYEGSPSGSFSACSSPYTAETTTGDGTYTTEIQLTDDVGNVATISRSFTLDTSPPQTGDGNPQGNNQQGNNSQGGNQQAAGLGQQLSGGPTLAQVASTLGIDLRAAVKRLRRLRLKKLLKSGRFTIPGLNALAPGSFSASLSLGGASAARVAVVAVARGKRAASKAGRYSVVVKLTKRGRKLLRRKRKAKFTLAVRFTGPVGTASKSASLKLKR